MKTARQELRELLRGATEQQAQDVADILSVDWASESITLLLECDWALIHEIAEDVRSSD